jgi:hypothetical protein
MRVTGLAVVALALLAGGCAEQSKEARVHIALLDNGVREPMAGCLSHQLAEQLSVAQLKRLRQFETVRRDDIASYLSAAARVDDPQALKVLATATALCKIGAIR